MIPGLIAGHYTYQDCHIDLQRLCQWAGVQFMHDAVTQIDPDKRTISTTSTAPSSPIPYDLLSINIGSRPSIDKILNAEHFGYPIKPIQNFLNHWHLLLNTLTEKKITQHIVIIGGGAAGIEVLLAMHYRIQKSTLANVSFTLINADKAILPSHNQAVRTFFQQLLQSLGVTVICNTSVTAIDKTLLHLNDGSTLAYNFAVWTIHAGSQSWPLASGLACDTRGFILVDQYLRSISHPEIFAAGDCAAFEPRALPKAGVYAVRQGPVLLKNLLATLNQQPLVSFEPQQRFLSLLTTGGRYAAASRGAFFLKGQWVWQWKNYIDRKFMQQFRV